jgi:transposase
MTTMTSTARAVIGGVDTHADRHVAAACDHLGAVLGTDSFPTTATGYRALLSWLRSFGALDKIGVEGTGSYGVGLARYLATQNVEAIEVSRPNRQVRRRHGKTDVVDAIAAARAVISGEATGHPKSHDGGVEALRALKMVHRSAHKSRTQALNQIRDLITTAPEDLRGELRGLKRKKLLATCSAFRSSDRDDLVSVTKLALRGLARRVLALDEEIALLATCSAFRSSDRDDLVSVTKLALRGLARRVLALDEEIALLDVRRRRITTAVAPALVAAFGVGPDTATGLLLAAGDNPERLGNERKWAALLASNPVQASSGKVVRHRLNRGGDRQGNSALWRIVIVRMSSDPDTQAYVARRIKQGKSKPEIIRCLKRYVAR